MTRERRFALTVIMATAGMNTLVTGVVVGLTLTGDRTFDITELSLLVFSIGCFILAHEVYRLRLREGAWMRKEIYLRTKVLSAQATARTVVKLARDAGLTLPKDQVDD